MRKSRERAATSKPQPAKSSPQRLDRVCAALTNALRILPATGGPDLPSPGELAEGLALILRARMNRVERTFVFDATFEAMDENERREAVEHLRAEYSPHVPIPPLYDYASEASIWASFSSHQELLAYMATIWHRLSRQLQDGFLREIEAWRTGRRE